MKKIIFLGVGLVLVAGVMLVPIGGSLPAAENPYVQVPGMDLSSYSDARPGTPLRVLFIHHSCGGQLLTAPGPEVEKGGRCLYVTHPNGGGLRQLLEDQGYELHEASYGSRIGDRTDAFDWLPKFRDQWDELLRVDMNDLPLPDGQRNQVVIFKSCYTESRFTGEGEPPGNPAGPDKTLANYKAHMTALLAELQKHPEVLFVYITPPPTSSVVPKERLWKYLLKTALGKPHAADVMAMQGSIARKYNTWIVAKDGWLADYPLKNVAVFDYYDVLTGHGKSNLSYYAPPDGDDHPTRAGNQAAAAELVPFFNRAVRRAGLVP